MNDRKIEIERNLIEKFLMWVKDYFKTRKKPLAFSLISIVIVIIIIIIGILYYKNRADSELKEFENILDKYYSIKEVDRDKNIQETINNLNIVIDKSMWGFVKKNGYYTIAGLFLSVNKYAEAKDYLLKFVEKSPSSFFAPLALHQAGIIYEKLNDIDDALKIYKQLEDQYKDSIIVDEIYYDLGRIYHKKGDLFKAKEYYNKVISEFPLSMFNLRAKKRLFIIGNNIGVNNKKEQLPE